MYGISWINELKQSKKIFLQQNIKEEIFEFNKAVERIRN